MAAAMLHLSHFPSTSSCQISRLRIGRRCGFQRRLPPVVTCSATTGKARTSRKIMSDADLCKGLSEFVMSVGFPEGHFPTTKELNLHGRKDLANIVRRRGHKVVKELLSNFIVNEQNTIHRVVDDVQEQEGESSIEALTSVEGVSSSMNNISERKTGADARLDDGNGTRAGSGYDSSFRENFEKFLNYKSLDVDIMEDNVGENLWPNGAKASKLCEESSVAYDSGIGDQRDGSAVFSKPIANLAERRDITRDSDMYVNASADAALGQGMNHEAGEMEDQEEVERLKQMLQQKELELSRLRELIDQEKEALTMLQTKAEDDVKNAQKLISEMDAELLAAEDSLAGLKEVQLQYLAEGKVVEVAGSFNGWHQPIKLDPHPEDGESPAGSRNSRLWHTSLWLYPGKYEIKFIVDGEWRVDLQREVTTRSGMQNNILRVEG